MSSTFFFEFLLGVPHKSRRSLSIYRPVLDMRKEIDRELASKLQTFSSASQHYLFINPWRSSTELLLKLGVNYYD